MLLKGQDDGTTRLSVRTKPGGVDATVLTGTFGGGGHARAAGATILKPLDEAVVARRRRGRAPGRGRQPVSRGGRSGGLDGVLIVAKPSGPTSHDVVGLVRRLSSTRRVGHGGTLDPFAAGVLPVFLGRSTRLVEYHLGSTKRYRATICFGERSTTDDIDGERTPVDGPPVTHDAVVAGLAAFTGPISQVPPDYSAVQIAGRRAYQLARSGQPVELAPREVTILALDLVDWDAADPARPVAVVDVSCSAGTYIRALARDLGAHLGTGAYLGALVRTASGGFRLEDAIAARRPARPRGRRTGGHRRDPPADRRRPRGPPACRDHHRRDPAPRGGPDHRPEDRPSRSATRRSCSRLAPTARSWPCAPPSPAPCTRTRSSWSA